MPGTVGPQGGIQGFHGVIQALARRITNLEVWQRTQPSYTRGFGTLTWPGASAFSNTITIPHGLAQIPTSVGAVAQLVGGGSSVVMHFVSFDGTNVQWRGHTTDGSTPVNTTQTGFGWWAFP